MLSLFDTGNLSGFGSRLLVRYGFLDAKAANRTGNLITEFSVSRIRRLWHGSSTGKTVFLEILPVMDKTEKTAVFDTAVCIPIFLCRYYRKKGCFFLTWEKICVKINNGYDKIAQGT